MRVAEPWASRLLSRFGGSGIALQIVCASRPRAESKPPNTCGTCCRPAPTSSELAPQYRSCRKYGGKQCTLTWGRHRVTETVFARSDRPHREVTTADFASRHACLYSRDFSLYCSQACCKAHSYFP